MESRIFPFMKVGVCGFTLSHRETYEKVKLLEVQQTFYKPPQEKTAVKWREEAPEEFEFTVKAWQVITHPFSSPTYRKVTISLGKRENYGFFQPSKEVFEAYEVTSRIAKALRSKYIVFQTPATFTPERENIQNMREFFSSLGKAFVYVWESRGKWDQEVMQNICEELDLIDGVDPFARAPVGGPVYFRLHGSPPGNRMYTYTYTDEDLDTLLTFCGSETYVLFNTITMVEDAVRFREKAGSKAL